LLGLKLIHYLHCKKHKINYKTINENWPYTFKDGWTDYFEDINLNFDKNKCKDINTKILNGLDYKFEKFALREYVNIIPEYYKYNKKTEKYINDIKQKLGLIDKEYGAIYIRRGDKLVDEIKIISADKFVDLLLTKYPECKIIFVQTDDYNSYLELKNYVHNDLKKTYINIITLCPETSFGSIANSGYKNILKSNKKFILKEGGKIPENNEYVEKIKNNLSKPISDMNSEEKYQHTMELITSVDICINSKYCVCDYKSNVSRFIKVAHKNFNNVFDINNMDSQISLDSKLYLIWDFDSKTKQK
jgi:hypothetical protein